MDFGNKNVNNLFSKDSKIAHFAALEIINNGDISSFAVLADKEDLIFDFLKEKALNTLISATNKDNVYNLFNFLDIYSFAFKEFIIKSLVKFYDDNIRQKLYEILNSGSCVQKTYAVLIFSLKEDRVIVDYLHDFIKSEYEPLKSASITALSLFDIKDEYNKYIDVLKNSDDDIEKLEAVDFLVQYNDKNAFDSIFQYFEKSGLSENIASNLLYLKGFKTLISENRNDEIFKLLFSILRGFPENIEFAELNYYLNDGIMEFLMESEDNFALLLSFYLKNKISTVLNNDAYSIDLNNNDKIALKNFENVFVNLFDEDIIFDSLKKSMNGTKYEILTAFEIIKDNKIDISNEIYNLLQKTEDDEIIFNALLTIQALNTVNKEKIEAAILKVKNLALLEMIKKQIEAF